MWWVKYKGLSHYLIFELPEEELNSFDDCATAVVNALFLRYQSPIVVIVITVPDFGNSGLEDFEHWYW